MRLLIFLLIFCPFFASAQGDKQATYLLGKVTSFRKAHPKIMGDFALSVDGRVQTGTFYYYSSADSQSVKLFFGPPDMDVPAQEKYSYWVVDKNKLWVYLSDSKVLIEQEVPEYFRTIGILGSGLSHYFAEYKGFSLKEVDRNKEDGTKIQIKELTFTDPIKASTAFSSVILDITDEGLQLSTTAVVSNSSKRGDKGRNLSFRLSNVNDTDPDFDEGQIFRVIPGGGTQVLRNVLMS